MTTDQEVRTPEHGQEQRPGKWPWIVGIVAALIAGVGIGVAGTSGGDTEPTATTDNSAEIQALQDQIADVEAERDEALGELAALTEGEPADEPEPVESDELEGTEYPLDVRWEDNGVTLAFDGIGFVSADSLGDDAWLVLDETETLIVLTGSITNNTGKAIEFYPVNGRLVVGDKQFEGFESSVGDLGGTVEDGVALEGGVVFESTKPLSDYADVTEVRFIGDAAYDTESWDDVTGAVELTIPVSR